MFNALSDLYAQSLVIPDKMLTLWKHSYKKIDKNQNVYKTFVNFVVSFYAVSSPKYRYSTVRFGAPVYISLSRNN